MTCAFCELPAVRAREVLRDELIWAFPTNLPIVPGHMIIAPIRCVPTVADLTPEEREGMFSMQQILTRVLKDTFDAEGFNYAWNEGEGAGQVVPHFHLQMLPRKKGDTGITEYEPRKFLYRERSVEPNPESELMAVAELIKKTLASYGT